MMLLTVDRSDTGQVFIVYIQHNYGPNYLLYAACVIYLNSCPYQSILYKYKGYQIWQMLGFESTISISTSVFPDHNQLRTPPISQQY